MARVVILALMGATIGAGGDRVHVITGVLWYPNDAFWGQAPWVPPLFAGAALALSFGHRFWMTLLGAPRPPMTLADGALRTGLFAVAYLVTGPLQNYPIALTVGLTVAFVPVAMKLEGTRAFAGYAVVTAMVGAGFEAALSSTGAFFYSNPDLVVPMWLPSLYLWAAPFGSAGDRAAPA